MEEPRETVGGEMVIVAFSLRVDFSALKGWAYHQVLCWESDPVHYFAHMRDTVFVYDILFLHSTRWLYRIA